MKNDNRLLGARLDELRRTTGAVLDQKGQLDEIDRWLSEGVNWFEQLAWLSENALPSQQMMVRDVRFNATQQGNTIGFLALLQNSTLMPPMVEGFRDLGHIPIRGQSGADTTTRFYTHRVNMTIRLPRNGGTALPAWAVEAPAEDLADPPAEDAEEEEPGQL